MALASKEAGEIHRKTGSDLTAMRGSYTNNKHLDLNAYEGEAAILYQMQLMQNDIDELRRYIISAELLVAASASSLPSSNKGLSSGDLYSDRGIVKVA
tara:strand:- start:575 stop:868 length:294 start_codon:yes stop_codon:yes gene_type:complete